MATLFSFVTFKLSTSHRPGAATRRSVEVRPRLSGITYANSFRLRRIGFVTYHHAKDALKAKKALNEDPASIYHGLIQVVMGP